MLLYWREDHQRSNYFKMRSLGWDLIQCDRCPHKKRIFGHRNMHGGENDVKTQGADGHLRAKGRQILISRPSEEASPANTFVWDFWQQNCETRNLCYLSLPVCGTFYGSPRKLKHNPPKPISQTLQYCLIKHISYLFSFFHHCNVNVLKAGIFAYFVQ